MLPVGFYRYGGRRKSPRHLLPWLVKLISEETENSEVSDQTEDSIDEDVELEQADSESYLSDEDEDKLIEQLSTELVDKLSSKSSPTIGE